MVAASDFLRAITVDRNSPGTFCYFVCPPERHGAKPYGPSKDVATDCRNGKPEASGVTDRERRQFNDPPETGRSDLNREREFGIATRQCQAKIAVIWEGRSLYKITLGISRATIDVV